MVINWEADSVFLCDEQTEAAGFARQQKTSLVFVKAAITCIASYPAARFSCWQVCSRISSSWFGTHTWFELAIPELRKGSGHLCWLWGGVWLLENAAFPGTVTLQFIFYCSLGQQLSDGCLYITLFLYFRLWNVRSIWFDTCCSKSGFLFTVVCYWSQLNWYELLLFTVSCSLEHIIKRMFVRSFLRATPVKNWSSLLVECGVMCTKT